MECTNDLTIGKLIKEYIGQNKHIFVMYVVFVLLIPLQDVGMPHLLGRLVKTIQNKESLKVPLAMIIGVIFLLQVVYSIEDQVDVRMFPTIQKFTRDKMLEHLFNMQRTNYQELQVGEVTTKIIKMPALMYSYMDQWKNLFIPRTVVFIVAIIYFFYQDWVIGLSLLILVLSLAVSVITSIKWCTGLAKRRDSVYNALYEEVDDVLRNALTVLNYNQEDAELKRIDTYHEEYARLSQEALICASRTRYTFIPIICFYLAFFTLYTYKRVTGGQMEPSAFVALFFIMIQITNSMWRIIGNVKEAVMRWGMIQETLDIFQVCEKYKEHRDTVATLGKSMPGIYIKDIMYKHEGRKDPLLNGFNLYIPQGEHVLIVGHIGSGKSTILKLMMKYAEADAGEIYVNNVPYSKMKASDLRRFVGYVPQNPILFNRSVYENITYGIIRHDISKQLVWDLIYELGLNSVLPENLDDPVGKYGSKVSGGQRQVIWILRTILQDPDVVLMDEPTSSMDEVTKGKIHKALDRLMTGKTVIMVTHDAYLMRYASRIVELDHGVIVDDHSSKSPSSPPK